MSRGVVRGVLVACAGGLMVGLAGCSSSGSGEDKTYEVKSGGITVQAEGEDGVTSETDPAPTVPGTLTYTVTNQPDLGTGKWVFNATCWLVDGSVFVASNVNLDARVNGEYADMLLPEDNTQDAGFVAFADVPTGHTEWQVGSPWPLVGFLEIDLARPDGLYPVSPNDLSATTFALDVASDGRSGDLRWVSAFTDIEVDEVSWQCP